MRYEPKRAKFYPILTPNRQNLVKYRWKYVIKLFVPGWNLGLHFPIYKIFQNNCPSRITDRNVEFFKALCIVHLGEDLSLALLRVGT